MRAAGAGRKAQKEEQEAREEGGRITGFHSSLARDVPRCLLVLFLCTAFPYFRNTICSARLPSHCEVVLVLSEKEQNSNKRMVVPTRIHMTALSSPSLANEKLVFAPFRIRVAFFIMVLISVSMTVRLTSGLATKSRISYWPRSGRLFSASAGSVSADNRPPIALPKICTKWLDLELPEGRCIGVSFAQDVPDSSVEALTEEQIRNNPSHWVHSVFHPDEIDYGLSRQESPSTSTLSSSSFWMGRLAMHLALDSISSANSEYPPVLKDSYGRPSMPPSLCGSITHKLDRGVALVAPLPENKDSFGIGIDLEVTARPGKRSIGPRVLTPDELNDLGKLPNVSAEEEVLLRFR